MFDLPEPFGPTITLTPGENSSLVRAGNDLNPFISIDLRYISRPRSGRLAFASDAPLSPAGASKPLRPRPSPPPSCSVRRRSPRFRRRRSPPLRRFSGAPGPIRRSRHRLRVPAAARATPAAPTSHLPGLRPPVRSGPRRRRRPRSATRSKPKATKQAPINASVTSGSGREPASRTFAGIASSTSGSAPSSIAGTPSSRPTSAQATPLTVWLWILVSPPASTSGNRSWMPAATARASTLSPR